MNINTYIDILILLGVTSNAYVNVKKHIKDKKEHQKPCLTLTYNNGYIDANMLAKANPHLHIHTEHKGTLFD